MTRTQLTTIAVAAIAVAALLNSPAQAAAEVCGDGIDNNADGLTDEGCFPAGVTGVNESPLSFGVAGAVAPKTGALVFPVQPDIAPTVPYGPSITLQRSYQSKYDPGYADFGAGAATDYKAPMGYRWHHNFMSWLELDTTPNPDEVVVHTVTGQDVLFTFDSTAGGYDYYDPQAGYHFDYLRQSTSSPYGWELRTLSGTVYEYDWDNPTSTGKVTAIKDGVGNAVSITYSGTGQVEWVKAAGNAKKLKFIYATTGEKLLDKVEYYTDTGSDTLRLTVDYTYANDSAGKSTLLNLAKYDGTTYADYDYTDDYLTAIKDGEATPKTVASFVYEEVASVVTGTTTRVTTANGAIGYEYDITCGGSGGSTYLYYHQAHDGGTGTACDADSDCTNPSEGDFCAGEHTAGSGNTGVCFVVRRCLVINSTTEHLVDAVSAVDDSAGGGVDCPSCVGIKDYVWDTTNIELDAIEHADSGSGQAQIWTTYIYNTDGLVTQRTEGDSNSNPTDTAPSDARITYYKYDNSSFPGKLTEVRRLSQLKSNSCDASTTTNCKRTIYVYTTGGLVDTVQQIGFTYNNAGSTVSYNFTTDNDYDSKGRITKLKGPRPNTDDDVEFTYHTASGLSLDYLNERKRKKDATTYITTSHEDYDFFGNAQEVTDPNSKTVCYTYDGDYNVMTARRQVINGSHTDCGTSGNDDEETAFTYDTHRRLTKRERPLGNCLHYAYTSDGQLEKVTMGDDSSGTCSTTGDTTNYTYRLDGQLSKTEWKDSSGSVKRRQEYTYRTDRRLEEAVNPVSTSYHKKWYYDDDGVPSKVELEDFSTSDAKTEWDVDDLNRTTKIRRYTTSSANEEWTLTQAAQHLGLPTEVKDEALHDIDYVWDDLSRKVKQETEEAGITLFIYDAAGNLTEMVEADGLADEQTTLYTYDTLNRLTEADNGDADCFTLGGAELQYTYDALPGGVTCPSGSTCNLLSGRLAYVKALMWCDNAKSDDMFDQETFYSYDEPGRIVQHTVQDDSARKAKVPYTYDKNSNVTRIDYPAGSTSGAVYDYGSTSDSDDDKVDWIKRDTTYILTSAKWNPFGPVASYKQRNYFYWFPTFYYPNVTFTRNIAYRLTELKVATTKPDNMLAIGYAEDLRGRYTKRNFTYGSSGLSDTRWVYDDLSRVTCQRHTVGSGCPTSGADDYYNIAYNTSGDRSSLRLENDIWASTLFTVNYQTTTSDELKDYSYSSSKINFVHDTLGRRTSDDDTSWGSNPDRDKRTYTYDGRNNLITVSGAYRYAYADWNVYTVTYAYDERNRIIFKSFLDEDLDKEAQWFFYWDQFDRLIESKYTPDIATSSTYSIFQWYWLNDRPFLYYQIDYPGATTTRRYLESDEQGRPIAAWSWPTSGAPTRVWEADPGLFGWDKPTVGTTIYQPLRFPGQLYDEDTEAWAQWVCGWVWCSGIKRPGIAYNRYRSFDSFTGTFLQSDPKVDATWDAYGYGEANPVMETDPTGLSPRFVGPDSVATTTLVEDTACTNCSVPPTGWGDVGPALPFDPGPGIDPAIITHPSCALGKDTASSVCGRVLCSIRMCQGITSGLGWFSRVVVANQNLFGEGLSSWCGAGHLGDLKRYYRTVCGGIL